MNYEETLKLIDAGFSADEIRQMAAAEKEKPEEKPPMEQSAGSTEHESEVKTPEVSAEIQNLTEQISKLNETVVKLQEANIKNARSGSAKVVDPVNEQIEKFIKEL